jgi:hypothetical protein
LPFFVLIFAVFGPNLRYTYKKLNGCLKREIKMGGGHLGFSAALPVSRFSNSTEDFDMCVFNGIKIRQYLTELLRF